ncbi:MAG: hypothetical protein KGN32_08770 [Burkholderiales bacterium]|nr:hypothetical protein [Burkholderiales bacterium]
MALALGDINEDVLKSWFDAEALRSKHQAARALMMFRGFLRWCAVKPGYRALVEAHILELAGVVFDATAEPGALRVVS